MESLQVPLTQGRVALVDPEDYELVIAEGRWFAHGKKTNTYAARNHRRPDGMRSMLRMHTFLTGWSYVDHRNGDGLDNRRANLRQASHSQNIMNARARSDNTSGFRGICWIPSRRKWKASIRLDGRNHFLGYHDTPEEAALAYDVGALDLHGEFARLNYPGSV